MPVERHAISRSQLCELLGVEYERFIAIERDIGKFREPGRWWIVTEGQGNDETKPIQAPCGVSGGQRGRRGGASPVR